MAHKVIVPRKKIKSRSFLNSGTLIVKTSCLYEMTLHCYSSIFCIENIWSSPRGEIIFVDPITIYGNFEGSESRQIQSVKLQNMVSSRGESGAREKVRGLTVHKDGSKIPIWLTVSPVYKLWWTPAAKSIYRSIFLNDDILLWCLHSLVLGPNVWKQLSVPRRLFIPALQ